ncbi:hypothetical protein GX645_06210 [Candidatus Sumerlaeota bacterium]|nr:O-antigen ligase family protein [Candidatus Sumerlaeales bacterium]NLD62031.1 hypothetical protein [Candidatus Sumerlaeota bacterium]
MLKHFNPTLLYKAYFGNPYGILPPILLALLLTLVSWIVLIYGVREIGILGMMIGAGAALTLLSVITHPLIPFALYFPCLFFNDLTWPGIPISPNQILGILFFVSWIAYFIRRRTIAISPSVSFFMFVATVLFAISAITGEDTERGIQHCRAVVTYFLMALGLAASMRSEKSIRALAWIITITTAAAALQGVYQAIEKGIFMNFTGKWSDAVRVSGTAKNSIVYGWNLLYAFPFAFFLYTRHNSKLFKSLAIGLGIFTAIVALLTFNRQTFLLLAIVVLSTTLLFRYKNKKRTLMMVLVAAGIAVIAMFPMVISRLSTLGNIDRDPSYLERRDQILVAMEMFKEKPIIGIGLGSYPAVWKNHLPKDYSTYNMQYDYKTERYPDFGYVQLLAETGVVGLMLAIALMLMVLRRAIRVRRMADARDNIMAFNLASMIIALAIFWITSNFVQDTFLYVRMWFVLGLTALITPQNLFLGARSTTNAVPLPRKQQELAHD